MNDDMLLDEERQQVVVDLFDENSINIHRHGVAVTYIYNYYDTKQAW